MNEVQWSIFAEKKAFEEKETTIYSALKHLNSAETVDTVRRRISAILREAPDPKYLASQIVDNTTAVGEIGSIFSQGFAFLETGGEPSSSSTNSSTATVSTITSGQPIRSRKSSNSTGRRHSNAYRINKPSSIISSKPSTTTKTGLKTRSGGSVETPRCEVTNLNKKGGSLNATHIWNKSIRKNAQARNLFRLIECLWPADKVRKLEKQIREDLNDLPNLLFTLVSFHDHYDSLNVSLDVEDSVLATWTPEVDQYNVIVKFHNDVLLHHAWSTDQRPFPEMTDLQLRLQMPTISLYRIHTTFEYGRFSQIFGTSINLGTRQNVAQTKKQANIHCSAHTSNELSTERSICKSLGDNFKGTRSIEDWLDGVFEARNLRSATRNYDNYGQINQSYDRILHRYSFACLDTSTKRLGNFTISDSTVRADFL